MWNARTSVAGVAAAALMLTATSVAVLAQDDAITIGYAVSKSGPNAGGADMTVTPNYELWVQQVNEAGGLKLPDGRQLPIEVIAYDDRSSAEEVVRAVERLATQDEVDFILPPWGTGFNLAVAPLMAKFGYPHLAGAAVTDKASEFVVVVGHVFVESLHGRRTAEFVEGALDGDASG